jgi:hypothetical protein
VQRSPATTNSLLRLSATPSTGSMIWRGVPSSLRKCMACAIEQRTEKLSAVGGIGIRLGAIKSTLLLKNISGADYGRHRLRCLPGTVQCVAQKCANDHHGCRQLSIVPPSDRWSTSARCRVNELRSQLRRLACYQNHVGC